jgi:hypothetical protein
VSYFSGAVRILPERRRVNTLPRLDDFNLEGLTVEEEPIVVGSGYSIALDNSKETPVLHVKTYGEVDSTLLRRRLEQYYPGAKIEGLTSTIPVKVCKGKTQSRKGKLK